MHVLITNDDGQPDPHKSPYVKFLIEGLSKLTDWEVSVCVPSSQKSWISKAHLPNKTLTASFIYSKIHEPLDFSYVGPFDHPNLKLQQDPTLQEWCLLDGTPSSCADIGIHHIYNTKPVDLVISGPNYGRNTTALYIMSSGTIGAAIESCLSGIKSIGLSFAFEDKAIETHTIKEAIKISISLIKHLLKNWKPEADLYSVNVPLTKDLNIKTTKIFYAPILENRWGSLYTSSTKPARVGFKEDFESDEEIATPPSLTAASSLSNSSTTLSSAVSSLTTGEKFNKDKIQFRWDPDYEGYFDSVNDNAHLHHDGKLLALGHVSVTAMKSVFSNYNYQDEIVLDSEEEEKVLE